MEKTYIAIDLKSFYASVECVERGLNPLDTNLVVADSERTEKTICLAVSPSLKEYGIPGRARLFEVVQRVTDANKMRREKLQSDFSDESYIASELKKNPSLKLSYITAPPRMALYTKYSTKIYSIYLRYAAPEDIHIYSIDEVFIDATSYINGSIDSKKKFALKIISDVLNETGITATAGIGTNMYLCKIAMDIMAKKMKPNNDGVRIAYLDEKTYRKELWEHTPLTDFWRVGKGYIKKLDALGIHTMGDLARLSLTDFGESSLYKAFGVNAELLIDHAWGWEPCTIADIKAYKPQNNSISSGQVLQCPYSFDKARLIIKEMTELLVLDLVDKGLVTNQMIITIGYDAENLKNSGIKNEYKGEIKSDYYGRKVPKHAHGSINLDDYTSSTVLIIKAVTELYEQIINKKLLIRRINVCANHVIRESDIPKKQKYIQLDLFTDYDELNEKNKETEQLLKKEKRIQRTVIDIKKKFGKNAVIRGLDLCDGATAIQRNNQIGGHKA